MIARSPKYPNAPAQLFEGSVDAGAPMVVAEGEVVVLAQFGSITRVIGPGSYQVPAEFAGAGVEAWFVSSRPFVEVKFGGPLGAPAGPKAVFGTCSCRVVSPERLVASLVGQRPDVVDGIFRAVSQRIVKEARHTALKGGDAAAIDNACRAAAAEARDSMGIAVTIDSLTAR